VATNIPPPVFHPTAAHAADPVVAATINLPLWLANQPRMVY
jgi:hypothetical protein